jgi:hypothetical protein
MIRRLRIPYDGRRHEQRWPEPRSAREQTHLFAGRYPYRAIRVMVDHDVVAGESARAPERELLYGFLRHPLVSAFHYADAGPPATLAAETSRPFLEWVVVTETLPGGCTATFSSTSNSRTNAFVRGNAPTIAERDSSAPAYRELTADEARKRRFFDARAVQVAAQALGADIYVTDRPYLYSATWDINRSILVCPPVDALAILGLYLRAQGEFLVEPHYRFNRGMYYWVGMRELLPAAWRWFKACVQCSEQANNRALHVLAGTLLHRVDRALEVRDQIHMALNQPQDNDTQDAARSSLDVLLVLLMAAVDVAARVAHRVLRLTVDERRAGWQNNQKGHWLDGVRKGAPALAAVVDPNTRGEATVTILRRMRNSMHGAALQGVGYLAAPRKMESLVAVADEDKSAVQQSMKALGGEERWGIREIGDDCMYLDPGVFADELFAEVLNTLNQLMTHTPVEELIGVVLMPTDCHPPPSGSDPFDPFAPRVRRSIRWQLGL